MSGKQVNFWVQNLDGEDIPIQEFREELYEVMKKFGIAKLQAFAQFDERFGTEDDGDVIINCYTHLEECQPVPEELLRSETALTRAIRIERNYTIAANKVLRDIQARVGAFLHKGDA